MFMALRVALWVLTILLVLIAPSCYSYEARKFWSDRFKKLFACGWRCCCCCCCCRRNTETPPVSPATAAAANRGDSDQDEQFHYVLSSTQEEEIRECFLIDKFRNYSMTIEEGDIKEIGPFLHENNNDETPDLEAASNTCCSDSENKDCAEQDKVTTTTTNGDNDGDNDDMKNSDDDDDDSVEFCVDEVGAEAGFLLIPVPAKSKNDKMTFRKAPNGCAVCLSHFEVDEKITWSSNSECKHIFHHECILDWFKATGRRHCRRRRRREQQEGAVLNYANNPLLKITNFPMDCPCCRQCFIVNDEPAMTTPEKDANFSERSNVASTVVSSSSSESGESEDFASETASNSAEVPQGTEDVVVAADDDSLAVVDNQDAV